MCPDKHSSFLASLGQSIRLSWSPWVVFQEGYVKQADSAERHTFWSFPSFSYFCLKRSVWSSTTTLGLEDGSHVERHNWVSDGFGAALAAFISFLVKVETELRLRQWRLGSSRSRCQQIQCLLRAHFLIHTWQFCPHRTERVSSLGSFTRVLIPLMRALPSGPNYLLKAPPLNTITCGVRISTFEFWGDTNIWSITNVYTYTSFIWLI